MQQIDGYGKQSSCIGKSAHSGSELLPDAVDAPQRRALDDRWKMQIASRPKLAGRTWCSRATCTRVEGERGCDSVPANVLEKEKRSGHTWACRRPPARQMPSPRYGEG